MEQLNAIENRNISHFRKSGVLASQIFLIFRLHFFCVFVCLLAKLPSAFYILCFLSIMHTSGCVRARAHPPTTKTFLLLILLSAAPDTLSPRPRTQFESFTHHVWKASVRIIWNLVIALDWRISSEATRTFILTFLRSQLTQNLLFLIIL